MPLYLLVTNVYERTREMKAMLRHLWEKYASEYAKECAKKYGKYYLDYRGLAELTDGCILCNNIPEVDDQLFDSVVCGNLYNFDMDRAKEDYENSEDFKEIYDTLEEYASDNSWKYEGDMVEIFQYFLVKDKYWLEKAGEIVLYSPKLDVYVWCVTHWGTSWDYVLSDLEAVENYEDLEG